MAMRVQTFFSFSENLKVVIAKQEAKVTEVEKLNAEMESAKKRTTAELKIFAEKFAKQEQAVRHSRWPLTLEGIPI